MTDRPVIIYDGDCRFCLWSVARIRRLDGGQHFEYVARQAPGVEGRFPILVHSDFDRGLRLIFPDSGRVHVGADGVYEIYRRLPPWHRVAWVYRVPGLTWLCRLAYALVARNRHRLGRMRGRSLTCDSGACAVSYAERRARDPDTAGPPRA